jgi:NADPH:quinone reductase-like Zn-dependent oxidoreductase
VNAAVVRSFEEPPRYETFQTPEPSGVDGVGRSEDGRLLYFVAFDGAFGTIAERTVIDRRRAVLLPDDADVPAIAAAVNPGMSSWVALRKRIHFQHGQTVLVLGATGNAGQMAVQIAKLLGAGHVVAAGRNPERLAALEGLGADRTVSLLGGPAEVAQALGAAAADVDVVIDYLWGSATEQAIPALLKARAEPAKPLRWIEIGSMAGITLTLPSAALRAANLQILGSGQGSVPTAEIVAELPELAAQITAGAIAVDALATPLSDVEEAWNAPTAPGQRIVFMP